MFDSNHRTLRLLSPAVAVTLRVRVLPGMSISILTNPSHCVAYRVRHAQAALADCEQNRPSLD
jgi:hypothetical protein